MHWIAISGLSIGLTLACWKWAMARFEADCERWTAELLHEDLSAANNRIIDLEAQRLELASFKDRILAPLRQSNAKRHQQAMERV